MHKLLSRQIKNIFGDVDKTPKNFSSLLEIISDTYDGFDQDRELTLRSLELSSQELLSANKKIRLESNRQKLILDALRKATAILQPKIDSDNWLTSKDEVIHLANSLKKLIEQQKRHENQIESAKNVLEKEKAKAEAILHSIGDGVFAVDLHLKIILMNSVAEKLSGYRFSTSVGRYYGDIFHFVHANAPNTPYPLIVEEVIKTGIFKRFSYQTMLIKKDTSQIPISHSVSPIVENNGAVFGGIVIIRDASREWEIERLKNEFILTATHQLRTPLGSMRWTLEMLLSYPDISQKVREKIELVNKSNTQMTSLVNDLLFVAQIDQNKIVDKAQKTDICKVVKESVGEIDAEVMKKHIKVKILSLKKIPKIMIDPKLLHDVILNLLSNAVKYNLEGGTVCITMDRIGKKNILVSVEDKGIGIPVADQEHIFKKFYRAGNAKKSDTSGSGIGLFVVKSYIEKWGGSVNFNSVEGKGSKFTIEIPVKPHKFAPGL